MVCVFVELKLNYMEDSRRANTVPDGFGRLGDVAKKIAEGGPQKIGSQLIINQFPELLQELVTPAIRAIWGVCSTFVL